MFDIEPLCSRLIKASAVLDAGSRTHRNDAPPVLIDLRADPEIITPGTTLGDSAKAR